MGGDRILTSSTTASNARNVSERHSASSAELCRLTILSAHTQVDLAVPLRIPLTLVIPGIVDTIADHRDGNEFDEPTEQFDPVDWTLARVGRSPLSPALSLHEHDVRDGELLVLETATAAAPPPLFDDIMYTVAATDSGAYRRWTPFTARIVGSTAGVLAAIIASLALILGETGPVGAVCAAATASACATAAIVIARVYRDPAGFVALGCAGVPPAFVAGILFVPGPITSSHLLLGSMCSAALALICLRLSGHGLAVFTALFVIFVAATGVAAGALALPRTPLATIGAVTVVVALVFLACAARLSMLFARLPLPPVPAPANPLADAADTVPEPDLPDLTELASRAVRARSYLTGLVVAAAVVTATGAVTVGWPRTDGMHEWPALALACVTAAVLMFRGRTYDGAQQSIPLVSAGLTVLLALLGAFAWTHRDGALVIYALAALLVLGALILGIIAPRRVFSPVMRRSAELLDLASTASIVPLVCWVSGLFGALRGL